MPALAILNHGEQDSLVQVRRRARCWKRAKQPEHASAAPDLSSTGGAALDVGGQPCGVGRVKLVEQERVDQVVSARAIQRVATVRVRHNTYMT